MTKGTTCGKQEGSLPDIGPSRRVSSINCRGVSRTLEPPGCLPTELWMEIIGEYSRKKEWLVLCKTSRFFHQIAHICLYKTLDLYSYHKHESFLRGDPYTSLALFEETFQARPDLDSLIHTLSLTVHWADRNRFTLRAFPLKFNQFPNLERLRLGGCRVNIHLRDTIRSCLRLRVLEFELCALDESHLTSHTPLHPQSSLVDLTIFGVGDSRSVVDGRWATFAPARLQSFKLFFDLLIDSNAILSNIMVRGNILEKLTISSTIPSAIISFLVSSTRLRHLQIHHLSDNRDVLKFSSLPEDAIPLLEQFRGPAELSPILLRNRPVHSVGLDFMSGQPPSAEILNSTQSSLVPVTTLKFFCDLDGDWLSHLPITICHLSFKPGNSAIIDESSLPALSRLTNLRTIYANVVPYIGYQWEALSREELLTLSKTFPSLREVELGEYAKWIMVEPMVWERFKYIEDR